MDAAARAFDLLTCKRAMEKGRGVEAVTGDSINVSRTVGGCWAPATWGESPALWLLGTN